MDRLFMNASWIAIGVLCSGVPARANPPAPAPSVKTVITAPTAPRQQERQAAPVPAPSQAREAAPSPLTEPEARSLMREFVKAQHSELKALDHQQKFEMQDLKQTQKVVRKEWESRERAERHKFFEEHPKGPDRRAYVKEFIQRGDAFRAGQKNEMNERKKAQAQAMTDLKTAQAKRLKEIEGLLARKQRPPESLWPSAGR